VLHCDTSHVITTDVPQYLVTQLDFDITSAGAIGGLPFLANSCGSMLAGILADRLHYRGMSNVRIRRIFTMAPQLVYMVAALFLASGVVRVVHSACSEEERKAISELNMQ
jgi:MFS family permease